MRRGALAWLTVGFVASQSAAAADPIAASAPSLPAPPLVVTVTPEAGGPWKLRVENTGDLPVRLAADPRLLALELSPIATDGKKKPTTVRCALPDDARPASDDARELVVPGKRSWSATIDPFFYCFGARERAALSAGTSVVARFGWALAPRAGKSAAPFVATPVGAAAGKLAPAKEIVSAPFTLAAAVESAPPSKPADDAPRAPLSLSTPEALDAARGDEVATTVSITNDSDHATTLLFRPQTIAFTVSGPGGSVTCGSPQSVTSPIRELFTTLAPKGKATLSVLLTAMCPADTFDEPGVYRALPLLDTTGASGRMIGLRTWEGTAEGTVPMLVRIRGPRRPPVPTRPSLD